MSTIEINNIKMSSALNLLQSIGGNSDSKPYKGFTKLMHGNHEIYRFRLVKNKQYNAQAEKSLKRVLLVELKDEVLFLPAYFAEKFNDSDKLVEELNTDGIKKFLFFGGKRPNK